MLQELLLENEKSEIYPFHMPGHKRNVEIMQMANPYLLDITEVEGFDDLHAAEGVLKTAMEKAAKLFGSLRSFFLVGGSSCGILAGVFTLTEDGGTVIAARNCHKSVYNALMLRHCKTSFIEPPVSPYGFYLGVTAESVEKALEANPRARLVIITSPTYEGIVSDIEGISRVCREHSALLLVDEAHGAHLKFSEKFPKSAALSGADIAVQSVHKTLPAFTQTALLHICSDRVDEEKAAAWLGVFQSSSPSYVLMAGIDSCCELISQRGGELFAAYTERLEKFYNETKKLKKLKVLSAQDCSAVRDFGKIVILSAGAGLSGGELCDILLKKYKLQLEMSAAGYAIAMTSVCDTDEGFERLKSALFEIDNAAEKTAPFVCPPMPKIGTALCTLAQGQALENERTPLEKSAGRISCEFVYAYPPGSPLAAPGELITEDFVRAVRRAEESGVKIKTSSSPNCRSILTAPKKSVKIR